MRKPFLSIAIITLVSLTSTSARAGTGIFYEVWRNTSNNLSTASRIESWYTGTSYYDNSNVQANQTYYYWTRGIEAETVVNSHSWYMIGDGGTLSMNLSLTCPTSAKIGDASPLRGEVNITVTPGSHDSSTLETAFKEADTHFNDTMASWEHTGQLVSHEHPITKTYSTNVVLSTHEPLNNIAEVYLASHYHGYGLTPTTTPIVNVALRDYSDEAPSNISAVGDPNGIQVNWNASTGNTGFTSAAAAVSSNANILQTSVYSKNGHVYHLLSPSTWAEAEAEAVALGGHLVSIGDEAENQWVLETFGPTAIAATLNPPHPSWLWIGFTDEQTEGMWQWTNGDLVAYTNWGDPNNMGYEPNGGTGENYAVMTPEMFNGILPGAWIDTSGGSPLNTFAVVEVVPEPATLSLLALGGLAMIRRRRRK